MVRWKAFALKAVEKFEGLKTAIPYHACNVATFLKCRAAAILPYRATTDPLRVRYVTVTLYTIFFGQNFDYDHNYDNRY